MNFTIFNGYYNTANYTLSNLDHSLVSRVTRPDAVFFQYDLLRMSTIVLETCRGM